MTAAALCAHLPEWLVEMIHDPDGVDPAYLPPACVCVCAYGTAEAHDVDAALEWLEHQRELQVRAQGVLDLLDAHFPLDDAALSSGDIPGWVGSQWALLLHVEWSRDLEMALSAAATWLGERGISVDWT